MASRANDEHQALRVVEQPAVARRLGRAKAELGDGEQPLLLGQDPHDQARSTRPRKNATTATPTNLTAA